VSTQKPREIAFRVLQRRAQNHLYIEDLLADELARATLPSADRSLAQELTYGVVRREATLDWLIQRKAARSIRQNSTKTLLRLGLYQLFWLERIPDHAAVHETVALSKHCGAERQAGFINALLRGYIRERASTMKLLDDLRTQEPALACSHPAWLGARWEKRWGREAALGLMDWNNQPPVIFGRVNTLRVEPAQLTETWSREQVESRAVSHEWTRSFLVFRLGSHPPLTQLESFQRGYFYVQDPSTLLAVGLLDPQPGETILDLCSAPGGKTSCIAQLMEDRGQITARDLDPQRLRLVRENCGRLGITCVQTSIVSERLDRTKGAENFARALVDAPCSNTGVMRRRIDVRWRLKPDEIPRLHASQLRLLRHAADQLAPGGVLVYSTCSLEPEENQGVIAAFLRQNTRFNLETERELTPFADGVDGAYAARLRKEA
jgi:16S rRNA (cytosine967-C5)-methyltransferase